MAGSATPVAIFLIKNVNNSREFYHTHNILTEYDSNVPAKFYVLFYVILMFACFQFLKQITEIVFIYKKNCKSVPGPIPVSGETNI
jgi:hypothetical protein